MCRIDGKTKKQIENSPTSHLEPTSRSWNYDMLCLTSQECVRIDFGFARNGVRKLRNRRIKMNDIGVVSLQLRSYWQTFLAIDGEHTPPFGLKFKLTTGLFDGKTWEAKKTASSHNANWSNHCVEFFNLTSFEARTWDLRMSQRLATTFDTKYVYHRHKYHAFLLTPKERSSALVSRETGCANCAIERFKWVIAPFFLLQVRFFWQTFSTIDGEHPSPLALKFKLTTNLLASFLILKRGQSLWRKSWWLIVICETDTTTGSTHVSQLFERQTDQAIEMKSGDHLQVSSFLLFWISSHLSIHNLRTQLCVHLTWPCPSTIDKREEIFFRARKAVGTTSTRVRVHSIESSCGENSLRHHSTATRHWLKHSILQTWNRACFSHHILQNSLHPLRLIWCDSRVGYWDVFSLSVL